MAKMIRISDEVYEVLDRLGTTKDTYDDVIRRLLDKENLIEPKEDADLKNIKQAQWIKIEIEPHIAKIKKEDVERTFFGRTTYKNDWRRAIIVGGPLLQELIKFKVVDTKPSGKVRVTRNTKYIIKDPENKRK